MAKLAGAAISKIVENPSQIGAIIEQVKGNEVVLGHVLKFVEEHPALKQQAIMAAQGNPQTMGEINKMSLKERRKMAENARKSRRALGEVPKPAHGLLINNSRLIKNYPLKADFPAGTTYASVRPPGEVEQSEVGGNSTENPPGTVERSERNTTGTGGPERSGPLTSNVGHGITAHYHTTGGPPNRRAKRMLGLEARGEVVLVRRDEGGNVVNLTESQLVSLFPEK